MPPTASPLFRRALVLAWLACAGGALAAEPPAAQPFRLQAQRLEGGSLSLEEARGRTALLVFWSPDSLAARKSMGELDRFAASPAAAGLYLLAVSTSATPAALRDFMAQRKLRFPVALRGSDDLGRINEDHLPLALVIDPAGKLLRYRAGMFNLKTLRELVTPEPLVEEQENRLIGY